MTVVSVASEPSTDRFQYEYRNEYTRGKWARGTFDPQPSDWDGAIKALQQVALAWIMGTDLRLVEITDDGRETFSEVAAKGNLASP